MKLYRLNIIMREPSADSGDRYVAEVPVLPGCRAWGHTAAEALANVQSVATAFIESYRDHGDPLPDELEAESSEMGAETVSEVFVAV